jgi:hypothetical protein
MDAVAMEAQCAAAHSGVRLMAKIASHSVASLSKTGKGISWMSLSRLHQNYVSLAKFSKDPARRTKRELSKIDTYYIADRLKLEMRDYKPRFTTANVDPILYFSSVILDY